MQLRAGTNKLLSQPLVRLETPDGGKEEIENCSNACFLGGLIFPRLRTHIHMHIHTHLTFTA
jgi:hypothetical protein